jgi:ABC-type spermidine/putrescine transport system permease subunit I
LYRMCDSRLRSLEEGTSVLFTSRIAAIVTIACIVVGGGALLGAFAMTLVGGSEYMEFMLAMIFFVSFLVGSYWWIVFGPGRGL